MSFRQGARQFFERRGAPTPPLPYDARVLYVETDGLGAYIDTGVIPIFLGSGASVVKLSAKYVTLNYPTVNGRNYLCGARWGTSHVTGVSFGACTGYSSTAGTTFRFILPTKTGQAPFDYNIRDIVMADGVLVVDGVDQQVTPSTTTHDPSTSFCLGSSGVASMLPSDPTQHFSNARFYSCKIYTNNVLVFDGIPVRKNGQGYIYDRVSGRLCGNAGASGTTVTYGADVPFDEYVEYLESTGTQYIDTGLSSSQETLARARFKFDELSGTYNMVFGGNIGRTWYGIGGEGTNTHRIRFAGQSQLQYYGTPDAPNADTTSWFVVYLNTTSGSLAGTFYVSGYSTQTFTSTATTVPVYLFSGYGSAGNSKCSISNLSIVDLVNATELMNLVPCRIGQVGYMYDRAHPTGGTLGNGLYPNLGTGAFTIGLDK